MMTNKLNHIEKTHAKVDGCQCPHCLPELWHEVPPNTPPYPDAIRTAAIDKYRAELDQYITRLETFQAWLASARVLSPNETDGQAFLAYLMGLEETAFQLNRLVASCEFGENFCELLTGQASWPQYIEYAIHNDMMDETEARREIDFQREKRPQAFQYLAALYAKKWGAW